MENVFQFLISIAVILAAAKICGEIALRLGQSAILGELLAGVLIGPAVFGFVTETATLANIAELGAIILLFEAGLSTDIREFAKSGGWAALVAVVGVLVPYILGYFVFLYFGLTSVQAIFAGAVLTATSVGITARVFMDLKKIDTREAKIVLGAAVIDDIIGLVILAVVLQIAAGNSVNVFSIARISAVAVIFLVLIVGAGLLIMPRLIGLIYKLKQPDIGFVAALVFCIAASVIAMKAGLATIVGAFAAGLVLSNTVFKTDIKRKLSPFYAVFVPVFFVLMGTKVDLSVFNPSVASAPKMLILIIVLFAAAFFGKIVSGFSVLKKRVNRLLVGVAMVPRGEVGLIFAGIGLTYGVFDKKYYSAIVAVIILTTFVAPIILKYLLSKGSAKNLQP